jgi:hypothetical protein
VSGLFARPSYQTGTVGGPRREVPDVAMLADIAPGYAVYCSARQCVSDGSPQWQSVGGTSAATPLLAGGLALVDQSLHERGRADLGRVNPLLYNIGRSPVLATQVFNDVTKFSNDVGPYIPGTHQPLGCCTAGPGYDDASGWGSVNLAKLAAVALLVQPRAVIVGLSLPRHQRPAAHGGILATVSCSDSCSMGAFAEVAINHGAPFTVHSRVNRLTVAGRKTLSLRFSRVQLGRLASALAHDRPILATVFAVSFDARGNVQQETGGTLLAIHA